MFSRVPQTSTNNLLRAWMNFGDMLCIFDGIFHRRGPVEPMQLLRFPRFCGTCSGANMWFKVETISGSLKSTFFGLPDISLLNFRDYRLLDTVWAEEEERYVGDISKNCLFHAVMIWIGVLICASIARKLSMLVSASCSDPVKTTSAIWIRNVIRHQV